MIIAMEKNEPGKVVGKPGGEAAVLSRGVREGCG